MTDEEKKIFWDKVKIGAEKIGVELSTYHVWKHRGRVSSKMAIKIYKSLRGTKNAISLDDLGRYWK